MVTFPTGDRWDDPAAVDAAAQAFLLAGVSYYKTAVSVVELPSTPLRPLSERDFLRDVYLDGMGEFAYRNGLDLTGLHRRPEIGAVDSAAARHRPEPACRPLIPFGGGIDSIVTVDARARWPTPRCSSCPARRPVRRHRAARRGDRRSVVNRVSG